MKKNKEENEPMVLKIVPDYDTFVNVNRWWSYECALYLIMGGRGIGKTTGLNIHCITDFMKNGDEFVYMRRYITELKKSKSMLDPIVSNVNVEGLTNGAFQWVNNKVRIGYGLALTAQQSFKSGMDFSKVKTLIFDEGILPTGGTLRYLPNEVELLFEVISTIFRARTGYRVFIIGNNLDIFNPFFAYFNIPTFEKQYIDKNRGIYCEKCVNSPALLEKEKQTPLYKMTFGTAYHDYHYKNKVLVPVEFPLADKPANCNNILARVIMNGVTLNIYKVKPGKLFIEGKNKVIMDDLSFVILEKDNPNYYYMTELRKSDLHNYLITAYYTGNCTYENAETAMIYKIFMELL